MFHLPKSDMKTHSALMVSHTDTALHHGGITLTVESKANEIWCHATNSSGVCNDILV